jgi:hypothetical protein
MFKPETIIFAPTGRCNLSCGHCRVTRTPGPLSAEAAVDLLRSARSRGVEYLGYSGGEPFLEPEFLCRTARAAVELDFLFDRVMTNGVWYRDQDHLRRVLGDFCEAGFDGTFGVSVDTFHGQDHSRLVLFFKTVFELRERRDCCEIIWTASEDDASLFDSFESLAAELGGRLILEEGLPWAIVGSAVAGRGDGDAADADDPFGPDSGYDDPDELFIRFSRIPFSPPAESAAWSDSRWFDDDFCAGPGNVLYVHPDGKIAVCCGFANENDALAIGRLGEHDYDALMKNAAANAYVRVCYEEGLGAERKHLEARGLRFPGKTADPCVFCDYLCKNGLSNNTR